MTPDERNKIIEQNMPLVSMRVMKINGGVFNEDMYQEGCIGLLQAVERFDKSKGFAFSTFAVSYIDGFIRKCKNFDTVIKPYRKNGRYTWAMVSSLSNPLYTDSEGHEVTLMHIIPSDCDDIEIATSEVAVQQKLRKLILIPLDRRVLNLKMRGLKQDEIAQIVGKSQSYVSRILRRIRKRLRF